MRRLLRRMAVLGSVVGVVMALNVSVALAHENGAFEGGCTPPTVGECAPHGAPVGQNLLNSETGRDGLPGNDFEDPDTPGNEGNAAANIFRNPNCPAHWAGH